MSVNCIKMSFMLIIRDIFYVFLKKKRVNDTSQIDLVSFVHFREQVLRTNCDFFVYLPTKDEGVTAYYEDEKTTGQKQVNLGFSNFFDIFVRTSYFSKLVGQSKTYIKQSQIYLLFLYWQLFHPDGKTYSDH